MRAVILFALCAAALCFVGLLAVAIVVTGGGGLNRDYPLQPAADAQPQPTPAGHRRKVTRAEFGARWPLTVEAGEVECIDGFIAVFHHGGTAYALNGNATSRGYADIRPIWKANPEYNWVKMDIGPLTDAALELCGD